MIDITNPRLEDFAAAAGITPLTHLPAYRADLWQIVTDAKGFESIHETNEDGDPGDLVAHVFGDSDRTKLLRMAPQLLAALKRLTFAARTSGGTAGPDPELMSACAQAEATLECVE
jgi:hypothetical protein